jgi:hypothetical protein
VVSAHIQSEARSAILKNLESLFGKETSGGRSPYFMTATEFRKTFFTALVFQLFFSYLTLLSENGNFIVNISFHRSSINASLNDPRN